jgi:hypothetical protein
MSLLFLIGCVRSAGQLCSVECTLVGFASGLDTVQFPLPRIRHCSRFADLDYLPI